MKFKEYLLKDSDDISEQAIAMKGDWAEGIDKISSTSKTVIDTKWTLLEEITIPKLSETFEFRQLRNSLEFILGYWTTETLQTKLGPEVKPIFETIFRIGLTRYKSIENKLKYKKLINVDGVAVLKNYTGKGISTIVYKYLVNKMNYTILGDEQQYFGARKLWARLSKELDVTVDIIDIKKKEVLFNNVVLHHGDYDEDFDKVLWDYTESKKNLRSVLISIK